MNCERITTRKKVSDLKWIKLTFCNINMEEFPCNLRYIFKELTCNRHQQCRISWAIEIFLKINEQSSLFKYWSHTGWSKVQIELVNFGDVQFIVESKLFKQIFGLLQFLCWSTQIEFPYILFLMIFSTDINWVCSFKAVFRL